MSKYNLCECSDPKCPSCVGKCECVGRELLYRVDMQDETGTMFCKMCADDAMESGLFTDSKERDARQAEYPDDIDEPVHCPICDGQGASIGALGNRTYYRCIQCGMQFSHLKE